ncbi:autotransporter outer membrane beta-barrel domain-containing protein, partial [Brevundimonas sp.]|uniref:autotransporter family protein n=1 Tax=Brevundimonas sp. TaxID=1871086 RepID=UPI00248897EF
NLGAGTLFNLGGVSTLTGSAAASQVTVNAGTLRLGASDRLADSALVSVSSGATFDVNSRFDTIGALFGTGTVAISSGQLSVGGGDSAFGGTLTGAGSLVHTGGLFTLAGAHSLQTLANTGGELRFLGTTSGGVAITGGSLTGAGTIGGALTVSGGATLSPGLGGSNALGTFAVGSLTLNGGTLALDVLGTAGGNLTDRLVVSGTANLTGGILAPTFQAPAGGYDFLTRYQFLTAGQRVGTFSNGAAFTAAPGQSTLFWRVRYDLAPNAAVLELRSLVDFTPGLTGSDNQRSIGQALTGGQLEASDDWAGVLSRLADLTPAQQQATFDSLGGEALADLSSALLAANDAFAGAVREAGAARIPGANPLNFASAFSFVGGRDGASAMVTSVLDAFDPSAGTGSAEGGWISVHASDVDLQGKQGQADLQTRLNAFVGGYAVGTGDFVLGAAAGASRMEGDVSGRQSTFESDLLHAAGYARYDNGRWAADLTASAYGGEIDSRRTVSVGAFSGQATGRTHGEGQSLSASVARRFVHEDGSAISVGLMQTLSRSTIDAFTETGAGGLSLEVADQERNWQTTQLNLRGTQDYQLSGQPLRMYGGLGVLITTGDREASGDMRFSGAAAGFGGFTVEGAGATPLAGTAELGFEYQPREGLTLSTGYRAVFSQRLHDNQIGARMSVQW